MAVGECRIIELPHRDDPAGQLLFAEGGRHVPFAIERVFFVHAVPEGAVRGGHSHRTLHQAVFCLAGSLDLVVDDGGESQTFTLEDPVEGLYLPPMTWLRIDNFSPGAAYAVLASAPYDESDYIRDRGAYLHEVGATARPPA